MSTPNIRDIAVAHALGVLGALQVVGEFQDSVIDKDLTAPPGGETLDDRYLLGLDTAASIVTATWAGHDGEIATFNSGGGWDFTTPTTGMFVAADDEPDVLYLFGGTTWTAKNIGAAIIDPGTLTGALTTFNTATGKWEENLKGNLSAAGLLLIQESVTGGTTFSENQITAEKNGQAGYQILSASNSFGQLFFGDTDSSTIGQFTYSHILNDMAWVVNGIIQMTLKDGGSLGVKTDMPNSRFHVKGSFATEMVARVANYTVTIEDHTVRLDATSGPFSLFLPTAGGIKGREYFLKKIDSSVNDVTVDPAGSETIEGNTTHVLSGQWSSIVVKSDGTNWLIVSTT